MADAGRAGIGGDWFGLMAVRSSEFTPVLSTARRLEPSIGNRDDNPTAWSWPAKSCSSRLRGFAAASFAGRLVAAHRLVTGEARIEHTLAASQARQLLL